MDGEPVRATPRHTRTVEVMLPATVDFRSFEVDPPKVPTLETTTYSLRQVQFRTGLAIVFQRFAWVHEDTDEDTQIEAVMPRRETHRWAWVAEMATPNRYLY